MALDLYRQTAFLKSLSAKSKGHVCVHSPFHALSLTIESTSPHLGFYGSQPLDFPPPSLASQPPLKAPRPLLVPRKFLGFCAEWFSSSSPPSPWLVVSRPQVPAHSLLYLSSLQACLQSVSIFPLLGLPSTCPFAPTRNPGVTHFSFLSLTCHI